MPEIDNKDIGLQTEENGNDLPENNIIDLKEDEPETNQESGNIFDDFSVDSSLVDEAQKAKEALKKDGFYYMTMGTKIFQGLSIILFIVCLLSVGYVYVQKNGNIKNSPILDPFCGIIKGDTIVLPDNTSNCSSISYIKAFYQATLEDTMITQTKGILSNLVILYEKENFLKSKDVTFLRVEGASRLKTIRVLEKFDELKKGFSGLEKHKLQCGKTEIDSLEKTLEVSCDAYSQSFENKGIVGFSGDPDKTDEFVSGTSISIANSFLNYIEKNSTDFTLIDRQKMFGYENVLGDSEIGKTTGFTRKTSFVIKLKINF